MPKEEAQYLVEQTLYPQYWETKEEDLVWIIVYLLITKLTPEMLVQISQSNGTNRN